jgi:hypothetical protein
MVQQNLRFRLWDEDPPSRDYDLSEGQGPLSRIHLGQAMPIIAVQFDHLT